MGATVVDQSIGSDSRLRGVASHPTLGPGAIVGYIDGTFDLFHFGHANVLRQAREQCDFLIVGVATDEMCHNTKKIYPVMSFAERRATVEVCRYADFVVDHTALDETDLVRVQFQLGVKLDRHLVGEDYGSWGSEQDRRLAWCTQNGVDTIRLERTPGISTTEIRKRFARSERPPADLYELTTEL